MPHSSQVISSDNSPVGRCHTYSSSSTSSLSGRSRQPSFYGYLNPFPSPHPHIPLYPLSSITTIMDTPNPLKDHSSSSSIRSLSFNDSLTKKPKAPKPRAQLSRNLAIVRIFRSAILLLVLWVICVQAHPVDHAHTVPQSTPVYESTTHAGSMVLVDRALVPNRTLDAATPRDKKGVAAIVALSSAAGRNRLLEVKVVIWLAVGTVGTVLWL